MEQSYHYYADHESVKRDVLSTENIIWHMEHLKKEYPNASMLEVKQLDTGLTLTKHVPDDACCNNENRSMEGGCLSCGDPCY